VILNRSTVDIIYFWLTIIQIMVMKNKLLFIAAIFVLASVSTQAQISWGLRGGINSSNMNTNITSSSYDLEYNKGDFGWHAGVIGQLKVLKFFVQPELLFSTSKFDLKYTDKNNSSNNGLGSQTIRKLDLPVMVGFKLAIFKLQVGPVATLVLNSTSDLLDENNIDQNLNSFTIGYQAGIGVELNALLLDFKYESNLSFLGDGMVIGGDEVQFDQRMSQVVFSIGYLF
jgi:hypothetical protein